jgi:Spy/CpxP family protein refolding chaperone
MEVPMSGAGLLKAVVAAAVLTAGPLAFAADPQPGKPMRMDEPMHGEMKKKGMKKGDVKRAAEIKRREMKSAMENETAGTPKK